MARQIDRTAIGRLRSRTAVIGLLVCAGPALLAGSASAQEPNARIQLAQAAPAQPKAAAAAAPASDEAAALRQRVEQLEEQLVDMQVIVGTLESLARGGGVSSSGGGGGADSVRVDGLETQVRAMAAQIQQLTDQVRALGGQPRRSDMGGAVDTDFAASSIPAGTASFNPPATTASTSSRFGSTTVTAARGGGDSIGGMIEGSDLPAVEMPPPDAGQIAALPPTFGAATAPNAADAGNAKQLYETAYGYLMQRDYTSAQASFEDFLSRYPQDSLAGNAQYWLGESHFVRGEYKAAATSFLKGYQNYAGNPRAADSLLKLAMSLDRLGQKDAACSSFSELTTRFPNAPENVKNRAKSERQRIGCS